MVGVGYLQQFFILGNRSVKKRLGVGIGNDMVKFGMNDQGGFLEPFYFVDIAESVLQKGRGDFDTEHQRTPKLVIYV